MAGKKLNVAGIANELQGASVFFQRPPEPVPSPPAPPKSTEELGAKNQERARKTAEAIVSGLNKVSLEKEAKPKEPPSPPPVQPQEPRELEPNEAPVQAVENPSLPEARTLAGEQASMLASNQDSVLAKVRETIRGIGKEVSYTRLTQDEKRRIMEVIYSFRSSSGIKTSENELMRIAINFLLEDYHLRKEESLLYKILHP